MPKLSQAALAQIHGAAQQFTKVAERAANGSNGYMRARTTVKGTVVSSNADASIPHAAWNFGFEYADEETGELQTIVVWNSPRFPTPRQPILGVESFLDILEVEGTQELNIDVAPTSESGITHATISVGQQVNREKISTLRQGYQESVGVTAEASVRE